MVIDNQVSKDGIMFMVVFACHVHGRVSKDDNRVHVCMSCARSRVNIIIKVGKCKGAAAGRARKSVVKTKQVQAVEQKHLEFRT